MTGFPGRRTITLEFEGAMAGAEVTLRAASIEVMLAIREASMAEAVPFLAEHLLEWNITDRLGHVVEFEEKAILREVEPMILQRIIGEWYKVAVGISAPLDPPSKDGQESPGMESVEPSIPMDVM
jgi:hypothetical protein